MKTSTLLTTLTASAALLVGAAACGSTRAAEKSAGASSDVDKVGAAHCSADKGPHEGSCAPGAAPPTAR